MASLKQYLDAWLKSNSEWVSHESTPKAAIAFGTKFTVQPQTTTDLIMPKDGWLGPIEDTMVGNIRMGQYLGITMSNPTNASSRACIPVNKGMVVPVFFEWSYGQEDTTGTLDFYFYPNFGSDN